MDIAGLLTFAAFAALAIERLIEALIAPWLPDTVAGLFERIGWEPGDAPSWAMLAAGLLFGQAVAWGFGVDLISPLALAAGLVANPTVGTLATGLVIGGGSNLLHDVFSATRRVGRADEIELIFEDNLETED